MDQVRPRPDLALIGRLDRVQRLLPAADRAAKDNEANINEPVHKGRVLTPAVLVAVWREVSQQSREPASPRS